VPPFWQPLLLFVQPDAPNVEMVAVLFVQVALSALLDPEMSTGVPAALSKRI